MTASVCIVGPAAWNRLVVLDHLPDPVPHMQFVLDEWETVGGTSAGKALGLTGLGRSVALHALIGEDADGLRVLRALEASGADLLIETSDRTERHLNLMTRDGARVSLFLSTPTDDPAGPSADTIRALAEADVIVLDLAPRARRLIPAARATGRPIWTDLHDYDGEAEFHRPFLEAADAVFLNADALGDPLPFMRRAIGGGASLVVCTLGPAGAVALDRDGVEHRVDAVPVEVVDTNGAGDAFMTGVLHATLDGADVDTALRAGAAHAASVLVTRHLHPSLDVVLA
ncbi:carbohydrate kinase family protein [Agromyces intestinalis]|uniref:Carbohydrate kinase family protein n=1 Tax=Agromyces intestinalis TaxID=2592652 RepID=A0A5C1YE73_9MICO|nr:PfkB family carbohydrate kinase [Agromyces intestinalis]QEO14421.1 carbohydrate kinase family protein [Agromyces intestinalis]